MIGLIRLKPKQAINFNAVIHILEKNQGGLKMQDSQLSQIKSDAMKIIRFSEKAKQGIKTVGGNKLSHNTCSYGMVLKWLIYTRRMTYDQFGKLYNGTTGQNINHLINRCSKERFFDENLERMCEVLNVEFDYFKEVCNFVEKYSEK